MADNGYKVKNKLNIKPAEETLDAEGDIAFNATSHKLEIRDNSATRSVVTEDGSQSLTNKTMSGASNTFSSIPASAVNTGAATTLDLSTSNTASTVNIGSGTGANVVNIGGANTTVNITGSVNNQNVTNSNVMDKLITINDGGAAASGGSAGIEIEEDGSITGYIQTASDRGSWKFKAPNVAGIVTMTPGASDDDVVIKTASQTLTNKTISTASNTIQSGAATSGQVLTADGASGTSWSTPASAPDISYEVSNLAIAASVGSNALTIAIKGKDGNDPSGSNVVKVGVRSSTLTSGVYNQRTITSALSMTVSSGSTLGHASNIAHNIWVYLIDNAGTLELAVSQTLFNENEIVSTTAEGGAGAADSNRTMYSTTARSNVSFRCIGLLRSTQTTAGTWAAVPTNVHTCPLQAGIKETIRASYYTAATASLSNATFTMIDFDSKLKDTHNIVTGAGGGNNTTPGSGWYATINKTGAWTVAAGMGVTSGGGWSAGESIILSLYVNSGENTRLTRLFAQTAHGQSMMAVASITLDFTVGDKVQIGFYQDSGAALNMNGTGQYVTLIYEGDN